MAKRAAHISVFPLLFDGREEKYSLWETIFLTKLHTLKLKQTILHRPNTSDEEEQLAEDGKMQIAVHS